MNRTMMVATVVVAATLIVGTCGHGAVTFPPPRNAVDRNLPPWNSGVPVPAPFDGEAYTDRVIFHSPTRS